MTIPKAIQAHAKKNGMTVGEMTDRGLGFYRKGGRDLIAFSLSDAQSNPSELVKQLDKRIATMKAGK